MPPDTTALPVLYRDDDLIAINKPAGLLVHRSPVDRRETRFALQILRDQIGQWVYPVHRLDKPTSGVLIFALNPKTAAILSQQFEQRQLYKHYLAIVRGWTPDEGLIDHPVRDDTDTKASIERGPARSAISRYRRLARIELPCFVERYPHTRYSLVELFPKTGRRHQLRRHMKHIGHPIIGDAKHGKGVHNRFIAANYQVQGLLLSCIEMQLQHPCANNHLVIRATPGKPFQNLVHHFGWQQALSQALPWLADQTLSTTD